jgi:hypothetical protein
MNAASKEQLCNELLILNQRVHTAFGDMFPHAGLLQIGGSRRFIQKSYVAHLKKIITDILVILQRCDLSEPMAKTSKLWNEIIALLTRLELHSESMSDDDINSIAITLYFASGAMWNYLVEKLGITPVPDRRYLHIEPFPILLKMTNRINNPKISDLSCTIELLLTEIPSLARHK